MNKIAWRKDIANAPKDQRVLLIATALIPSHVGNLPEIVVGHWYEGTERWVIANVLGEGRHGPRLELKPIYWAHLCELPADITLRPLSIEDFKG